jgi:putative FmdB family regulatory protein
MPIYEYKCTECGNSFEKLVSFSETERVPACPSCKSKETRKKISAVFSFGTSGMLAQNSSGSSCDSGGGFT